MQSTHIDVAVGNQPLQRARGRVNFGRAWHEHKHITVHAPRQLHGFLRRQLRHVLPRWLAAILNINWKVAAARMHMLRGKRGGERVCIQRGAHDNKG